MRFADFKGSQGFAKGAAINSRPEVPTRVSRKTGLTPKQAGCGCLSVLAILVTLGIIGRHIKTETATNRPASRVGSSTRPATRRVPTPSTTTAGVGDVVIVHSGLWVCGSTKEAFWEMTKWAVRGDKEMFRVMRRTSSFGLRDGAQVKILDLGITATKVRVLGQLDPEDGRVHAYPEDVRIGRECWVASEAVTR